MYIIINFNVYFLEWNKTMSVYYEELLGGSTFFNDPYMGHDACEFN